MAAGRFWSAPRPFWRVLALTGTPTSASRWLSSRSWRGRGAGRLDQRTGEAQRPPGRPQTTALAIALTTGSISRGEQRPRCRPRAKLENSAAGSLNSESAGPNGRETPPLLSRRK